MAGDRLGAGLENLGHGQQAQVLQVLVAVLNQNPANKKLNKMHALGSEFKLQGREV